MKIDQDYIVEQYRSGVKQYVEATSNIGLWVSEWAMIKKYIGLQDRILDLGCGTGRTTFGIYEKGYRNMVGVDLTPEMIAAAQEIQSEKKTPIDFRVGDATQLDFGAAEFDAVLFSFNGLFSIPSQAERLLAMREVHRVLKEGGIFIFTSHDRDEVPAFAEFWDQQKLVWKDGQQDARLYEFGDIIANSASERSPIYIHIPSQKEVLRVLERAKFKVLESFMRDHAFKEKEALVSLSNNCRFWIAQKGIQPSKKFAVLKGRNKK